MCRRNSRFDIESELSSGDLLRVRRQENPWTTGHLKCGRGASLNYLTVEQQARLDSLLAELNTLPTPELIYESARLRLRFPLDDSGKKRMRMAFAGAIAAQKLLAYIVALEDVDDHRGTTGRKIDDLQKEAVVRRAMRSLDAADSIVMAGHLAGRQEVDFHFFAVCVGRIERFLPIAAKSTGYKVPNVDRDLLSPYRALRDYYEHMEDRLPGGKNYDLAASEEDHNGVWRIRIGIGVDDQERIVTNGVAVDVSPRGLATIRDALRRNWEQLKPSTLELVRKHFEVNPTEIPGPDAVDSHLLVSVGGLSRVE